MVERAFADLQTRDKFEVSLNFNFYVKIKIN
jgi:hypothetical protein